MTVNFDGEEWRSFASKLAELTRRGRLEWAQNEVAFDPETTFIAEMPSGVCYQLSSADMDGRFPYVLTVIGEDGKEIANLRTVPYDADGDYDSGEEAASAIIDNLYPQVARLVTGAPQRAKSLLDELDGLSKDESPF